MRQLRASFIANQIVPGIRSTKPNEHEASDAGAWRGKPPQTGGVPSDRRRQGGDFQAHPVAGSADHPDAIPDRASHGDSPDQVPALISPSAVLLAVAGARNAGVSTVIETFGVRGDTPSSIARVEEARA
jgi:hypothetical protein